MATSTVENYLKHMLLLSEGGEELVSMGALAEALAVVPGTVTTMVKALADSGHVEHRPRQGVRLTAEGRRVALNVLRKHRLVECFLVNVLKHGVERVMQALPQYAVLLGLLGRAAHLEDSLVEVGLLDLRHPVGRGAFPAVTEGLESGAGLLAVKGVGEEQLTLFLEPGRVIAGGRFGGGQREREKAEEGQATEGHTTSR